MNIETRLDKRLWSAIQSAYEARNFTAAILDAIYFLSNIIREKTGLESDGVALAGQALGGSNPPLKVNSLRTESEQNVQKGLEQLLRGIYQSIRNPRSHEKISDSAEDADAIIIFINYLLQIIDKSKSAFTKAEALRRAFDTLFVSSDRYAQLLAEDIPPRHRLEVYVDAYRAKETGNGAKLAYFFRALFSALDEHDRKQVYELVSEDMISTETDSDIRLILQTQPSDNWPHYAEAGRLRIENKLIDAIREGRYSKKDAKCLAGGLATWATSVHKYFVLRTEYASAVASCLLSTDDSRVDYAVQYFLSSLIGPDKPSSNYLNAAIERRLKAGDVRVKNALQFSIEMLDADNPKHKWATDLFGAEYEKFKEVKPEEVSTFVDMDDDIPF